MIAASRRGRRVFSMTGKEASERKTHLPRPGGRYLCRGRGCHGRVGSSERGCLPLRMDWGRRRACPCGTCEGASAHGRGGWRQSRLLCGVFGWCAEASVRRHTSRDTGTEENSQRELRVVRVADQRPRRDRRPATCPASGRPLNTHIALNALLPNAWLAQLVRAQVSYMHMSDQ